MRAGSKQSLAHSLLVQLLQGSPDTAASHLTLRARHGTHDLLALRARFPVSPALCASLPVAEISIKERGRPAVPRNGVDDQGIQGHGWGSDGVFLCFYFGISAFKLQVSSEKRGACPCLARTAKEYGLQLCKILHVQYFQNVSLRSILLVLQASPEWLHCACTGGDLARARSCQSPAALQTGSSTRLSHPTSSFAPNILLKLARAANTSLSSAPSHLSSFFQPPPHSS